MIFKKLECIRCVALCRFKLVVLKYQLELLGLHTLDVLFFKQIIHMKNIFFEQLIGHKCFHTGVKKRHFIVWIKDFFFCTAKQAHQLITMVVKRRMAHLNTATISTAMTDKGIICVFQHQVLYDKQDVTILETTYGKVSPIS